jgi:hypothetical protein
VRLEALLAKSDILADDDDSTRAERVRSKTLAEEARLTETRSKLHAAKADLAAYGVAIHGVPTPAIMRVASAKPDDEDAAERKGLRLLKRKLSSPKEGWKDSKGATISAYTNRHLLFLQHFEIF